MNYSRAFSYVFEDKNWPSKILIAGLISLIPIIGQLYIIGWMVEIVRRVKANRTDVIPTTHFSYFLTLGLKLFVVSLIYSIPVLVLTCIINLITGAAGSGDSGNFASAFLAGLGCIGSLLSFVLSVAVALLGTYGTIKLAETDQIKACLDFTDAFNCIKANFSAFIIVELLAIVAGLIQSAGMIVCMIGVIFTVPYGVAITGNLVGQLWDNLKPYEKAAKPVRGAVSKVSDDIVEEAPFTKVRDIEKAAEEVQDYTSDAVEELQETADEAVETAADAVEEIAENFADVQETAEEAAEDAKDLVSDFAQDAQNITEDAAEEIHEAFEETAEAAEDILEAPALENNDAVPDSDTEGSETLPPFE